MTATIYNFSDSKTKILSCHENLLLWIWVLWNRIRKAIEDHDADMPLGSVRSIALPPGWEGLSIVLRGNRCIVPDVPTSCSPSVSFGKDAKKRKSMLFCKETKWLLSIGSHQIG
jgi:hypothetical protein